MQDCPTTGGSCHGKNFLDKIVDELRTIVPSVDFKLSLPGVFHSKRLRWAGGKEHSQGGIRPVFGIGRLGKGLSTRGEVTTVEHGLARASPQLAAGWWTGKRALERLSQHLCSRYWLGETLGLWSQSLGPLHQARNRQRPLMPEHSWI